MMSQEHIDRIRQQILNPFVPDILCPTHDMPMLVEMLEHDRRAVVYCSQCGQQVTVEL
jgi:hypothetical protein